VLISRILNEPTDCFKSLLLLFLQEVWRPEGFRSNLKIRSYFAANLKVESFLKSNGFNITKSTVGGNFKSLNSGLVIATKGEIVYEKFLAFDSYSGQDSDKTKGVLAAGVKFPNRTILALTTELDSSTKLKLKEKQLSQIHNFITEVKMDFREWSYTVFAGDLHFQLRSLRNLEWDDKFFPSFKNGWDQNKIVKTYAGLFGEFKQVNDYVFVEEGKEKVKNIHFDYPLPLDAWFLSDSDKSKVDPKKTLDYYEIEKWFRKNKSTSHAGILAKIT
jgi:hypothetical protein